MATKRLKMGQGGPGFVAPELWSSNGENPGTPLSAEDRAMLAAIATIVRFRKGEKIYDEGEAASAVFNIVSGVVETYRAEPRHIVGFFFASDIVGLAAEGKYVNSAKAVTAVTMYRMPTKALEARLKRNPGLDFQVISKLCHDLRETQRHAFLLARPRADAKIGLFLQMLEAHQAAHGGSDAAIQLPMSRVDIASYLDLSPETVSRVLGRLAARGTIRMEGRRHVRILDPRGLEAIVLGDEDGEPDRAAALQRQ